MPGEGAALVLTVTGGPGNRHLTVSTGEPDDEWGCAISDGELDAVHEKLRESLTRIHDVAGDDLTLTPTACAEAVDTLSWLARRVAYGLFKGSPLGRLRDTARDRAPFASNPAVPPRIVEISTPQDFGYPFELVPWHAAGEPTGQPALWTRTLLGMSAIVRRRLRRVGEPGGIHRIGGDRCLPITVFRHPELTAAEGDYLRGSKDLVDVYGPWPGADELPDRAVVRHLLDSRHAVDASPRDGPAAVLHLACHCYTASGISDEHEIDVGGEHGTVSLGHLKTYASEPEAWEAELPRPLVFLNACGSAVPPLASRVSFPEFFLDQQSLGVVGTLCDISDDVAAHFAAVFYEALLRGRSVGEAMYDARWHLMDRHRNPLGLLYTFYGNPDLRVAYPGAGEVVPACRVTT